ncbi:MAG: hypothetical protein ACSW8I_10220, partial [bacterium]
KLNVQKRLLGIGNQQNSEMNHQKKRIIHKFPISYVIYLSLFFNLLEFLDFMHKKLAYIK